MDKISEKRMVENYASNYITSDDSSQQRLMREMEIRIIKSFSNGGRALELGCEIGYMSMLLSPLFEQIDIIDASELFIEKTKARNIPNVHYICSLFEDYAAEPVYDFVIASHVLEHLYDVQDVLKMVKRVLKPQGLFFAAVPNAKALSRQLARHMGLINHLYDLTPNDLRGGHRRVYDQVLLSKEIESTGFEIVTVGGILFKPFADFQMDKIIDSGVLGKQQCEGLYRLGLEYPDMCADVYAIARITNKE